MKTIIHPKILPIGLGLLAALPALAIEPPKDDAPPPPSVKGTTSAPAEIPVQKEEQQDGFALPANETAAESTAFIGLITTEVPEVLATHLGAAARAGVLVRDLVPDGPAHKAGLAKYDIITRVAGKSVGSPKELSDAVGLNKPGDEITIDLIHEGKETTKTVKLEARPERIQQTNLSHDPDLGQLNLNGLPREQAERLRDLIDRSRQGLRSRQRELQQQMDSPAPRGIQGFQFKSDSTVRLMDENGTVEMKSSDGSKIITVRDRENKVTWSGPWDSEQDKAAAPADVRDRIEKLKFSEIYNNGTLKFRMGPGFPGDEE